MGKRGGKRGRGGHRGGGRSGGGGGQRTIRTDYSEMPKDNDLYESYYNELGLVEEEEREEFWTTLRRELPNSFRFTDMCAAPGSKAAQLIEMVHGGEEARMRKAVRKMKEEEGREPSPDGKLTQEQIKQEEEQTSDWSDDGRSTGLLIANDADYKRAHMLIHQMKRLNSPNLIVTNHDATMFPSIRLPSEDGHNGAPSKGRYLKFDRILADVPCSGDGTCRKNINVWKDWNPGNALGLFPTQVRILDTGAFFITVLEKKSEIKARPEAEPKQAEPQPQQSVIASIVNAIEAQPMNGTDPLPKIDALDSVALPPPTHEEGVSAAARQNKENAPSVDTTATKREHDADADALMSAKRPKFRDEVDEPAPQGAEDRQVHYPPPPAAQLDASHPERQTDLPSPPAPFNNGTHQKTKNKQPFEEPFKYISPNQPELESIYSFYNLSPQFPRDRFMVRNSMGHPSKTIYYTSALARDILTANATSGIKFVHCGVKMFVKQDVQSEDVCRWRIQAEGLPILESWVGENRI
ncbi:hypothetical protein P7C71_g6386, partial [Lecanoromycetidae sp. Uapishka_2]